jgi:uncharacterized integral membrane protein
MNLKRTQWKFILFLFFSICAFFAVINGYDFFHPNNSSGAQAFSFLIPCAASLFLGFHLLKAYTDPDPLPAWLTYFSMPLPKLDAEKENKAKRGLIRINGFMYVLTMIGFIVLFETPRLGYSPERMVLPIAFGVLAIFVFLSLLQMLAAFFRFWKDRKTSNSADKT